MKEAASPPQVLTSCKLTMRDVTADNHAGYIILVSVFVCLSAIGCKAELGSAPFGVWVGVTAPRCSRPSSSSCHGCNVMDGIWTGDPAGGASRLSSGDEVLMRRDLGRTLSRTAPPHPHPPRMKPGASQWKRSILCRCTRGLAAAGPYRQLGKRDVNW